MATSREPDNAQSEPADTAPVPASLILLGVLRPRWLGRFSASILWGLDVSSPLCFCFAFFDVLFDEAFRFELWGNPRIFIDLCVEELLNCQTLGSSEIRVSEIRVYEVSHSDLCAPQVGAFEYHLC